MAATCLKRIREAIESLDRIVTIISTIIGHQEARIRRTIEGLIRTTRTVLINSNRKRGIEINPLTTMPAIQTIGHKIK